jgi:hypothetical protein
MLVATATSVAVLPQAYRATTGATRGEPHDSLEESGPHLGCVVEVGHLPAACQGDIIPREALGRRGTIPESDHNSHDRSCNPPSFRRASCRVHIETATWSQDPLAQRNPGQAWAVFLLRVQVA